MEKQKLLCIMKFNFFLLFLLALSIGTQNVMAAGDSREVIYECKIVTIKGEVIEGKFIDSVAYNEIQPPACDKNRIANKTIYRNAYTYNMLPISKMITKNAGGDNAYKDVYNTLRNQVFVSDKDLLRIASRDIASSSGFAPKRIIGDIPFVILPDKAMQLLTRKTPYAIYDLGAGINISVISYNKGYDDKEKLKKVYWFYETKYLQTDNSKSANEDLGYEQLRQTLESLDIVFIKVPANGD